MACPIESLADGTFGSFGECGDDGGGREPGDGGGGGTGGGGGGGTTTGRSTINPPPSGGRTDLLRGVTPDQIINNSIVADLIKSLFLPLNTEVQASPADVVLQTNGQGSSYGGVIIILILLALGSGAYFLWRNHASTASA